jgi:hypothetical protein
LLSGKNIYYKNLKMNCYGSEREKVAGDWRRRHNEQLHKLNTSSNIVRVIKSKRMRWAGHWRDEEFILQ